MNHKTVIEIQDILKSYKLDCWLMYSSEESDPYFTKYITGATVSATVCLITTTQCFLIANDLDFDNITDFKNIVSVKYNSSQGNQLFDKLSDILSTLNYPQNICLSYSTMRDTLVDVLGHGTYIYLSGNIKKIYEENNLIVDFPSAEKIIYGLSDRHDDSAIEKLKICALRADDILREAFAEIRVGMTEKNIVEIVHNIFDVKPDYFFEKKIINEEYSWQKEACPIVLAGPSFTKGGHAMASDLKLEAGFTVYFDFGVKLFFEDGSFYSSDIQRMGYILKVDEQIAPKEVNRIFETLYDSVTLGIENLVSGRKGFEVDNIVRKYIKDAGYIDYDHATGHSIGEIAHNPGTLLGPESRGLSQLEIQPKGAYTIEPRIPVINGGSIEEMVLATEDGGIPISPRQKELYLIKGE